MYICLDIGLCDCRVAERWRVDVTWWKAVAMEDDKRERKAGLVGSEWKLSWHGSGVVGLENVIMKQILLFCCT